MPIGIIVVQAGAIEKDGVVRVQSHWHFILKAYGQLLSGTKLVCTLDRRLLEENTLPMPEGLEPVLFENMVTGSIMERLRGYWVAKKRLKNLIEQSQFVGIVLPANIGSMAVSIAISLKKPFFIDVAGGNKFYTSDSFLQNCLRYIAYRHTKNIDSKAFFHADLVLYVSRYLFEETLIKPKQYAVVPHTTIYDRDLFERVDTCTKTPIRIFSANHIFKEKGLQYLLEAIKRLREQNFDVIATLAGGGDYLSELKAKSLDLGIDKYVNFTGHINTGEKLWQLYRQADIMVFPTVATYEGTPKSIIEAMASGCPVVASSIAGVTNMLKEAKSGKLVAPGNVDALVEGIKQVILNGELRRKYIADGLKWASSMTLEKRTEVLRKLLTEHLLTRLGKK